jgi:TolA-binding protein
MLKPRQRITKKKLKEDKLVTFYFKASQWFEENSKYVYGGLAALVIIAAATWFYISSSGETQKLASVEFLRASRAFDEGRVQSAMTQFQDVVNNYGGSNYGVLSRFFLAKCHYLQNDYEQALEQYQSFLNKYSGIDHFETAALGGVAASQEQLGQFETAANTYVKAANKYPDSFFASQYLLRAARNYEMAEQKDKAVSLYEQIIDDYPESQEKNEAIILMQLAKG